MRYDFTGAFAPYICGLIAQKRAFGFDYLESERILWLPSIDIKRLFAYTNQVNFPFRNISGTGGCFFATPDVQPLCAK